MTLYNEGEYNQNITCVVSQAAGLDVRIVMRIGYQFQAHAGSILALTQFPHCLRIYPMKHTENMLLITQQSSDRKQEGMRYR